MILGVELEWGYVIVGGFAVMLLFVFQMLVGLRVIHFKGRTHAKVHRWGAFVAVGFAAGHGMIALILYKGWTIL